MDTIERNKNLIKKFETMINTADVALANELIAADASFFTPASSEVLYGAEGYLSIVQWMRKSFSDVQWHIQDMIVENNKVAIHWELTGTHDGNFMGIKATGKKISVSVMNFYYINSDGKITNDVAAEGMIGILRGIGAIE